MQAPHLPDAVERYAKHAAHVEVEDADNSQRHYFLEKWDGAGLPGAIRTEGPAIREGYLALDLSWTQPGATLSFGLVLCNAGFHSVWTNDKVGTSGGVQ